MWKTKLQFNNKIKVNIIDIIGNDINIIVCFLFLIGNKLIILSMFIILKNINKQAKITRTQINELLVFCQKIKIISEIKNIERFSQNQFFLHTILNIV